MTCRQTARPPLAAGPFICRPGGGSSRGICRGWNQIRRLDRKDAVAAAFSKGNDLLRIGDGDTGGVAVPLRPIIFAVFLRGLVGVGTQKAAACGGEGVQDRLSHRPAAIASV